LPPPRKTVKVPTLEGSNRLGLMILLAPFKGGLKKINES